MEATVRMMKNMMKHHNDGRKKDASRPESESLSKRRHACAEESAILDSQLRQHHVDKSHEKKSAVWGSERC